MIGYVAQEYASLLLQTLDACNGTRGAQYATKHYDVFVASLDCRWNVRTGMPVMFHLGERLGISRQEARRRFLAMRAVFQPRVWEAIALLV